jgi:hypothetical protein
MGWKKFSFGCFVGMAGVYVPYYKAGTGPAEAITATWNSIGKWQILQAAGRIRF